jgi:hypothetical protein
MITIERETQREKERERERERERGGRKLRVVDCFNLIHCSSGIFIMDDFIRGGVRKKRVSGAKF